jgi:plasmid maintenance system antidote protein VapI
MSKEKVEANYTLFVSDSFERTDEKCTFEISFRRWLVREIEEQRMTISEAIQQFNFNPKNGSALICSWRVKYAPEMVLPLTDMTEAEKQKLTNLQKQLKAAEKQLEDARMRNIALNMLIDVAEEKLNISIRKKPGAKQ